MNSYADLKSFKSYFQLTETTYDADLLDKLIDGSRDVDKDTGRFLLMGRDAVLLDRQESVHPAPAD